MLQNWDDIVDLCVKDRAIGHGAETAMDADEVMSRETNEVEFIGLGAAAIIDLEEPSSITKGKRQGSTSFGTHPDILTTERLEKKKRRNNNFFG